MPRTVRLDGCKREMIAFLNASVGTDINAPAHILRWPRHDLPGSPMFLAISFADGRPTPDQAGAPSSGPQFSYCQLVRRTGRMLAVPHPRLERRAGPCGFMLAEGFGAYLGAPVHDGHGAPVATMAAVAPAGRIWSTLERVRLAHWAKVSAQWIATWRRQA